MNTKFLFINRTQPAGDVDYATHGDGYATKRRTDPRIAAWVHRARDDARTVPYIGAGAGVLRTGKLLSHSRGAVGNDACATAQLHLVPAIHGIAEQLPL